MGKVYLGQSRSGRRLAIKVLSEHFAEDAEYRERFAREVAAARLVSPLYTAAVVDSDKDAVAPWLATTFIDGPSLEEWVEKHGKLTAGTVLALALGLAEALASIHQAGLVHRDLKPSNIIIDANGPHIIDFGIALSGDATRITTSMLVGTPSYMAPERINGTDAGPAGDIFSLGATLFFAATGTPLIKDGTFYEQVIQVALGRFDMTDVPVKCQPLITRCLSKDPQDRPTATELVQILVGIGATPPAEGWWAEPEPIPKRLRSLPEGNQSRRRLLFAGGAFGLALLGGGAAAAWSRFRGGDPVAEPTPTPTPSPSPVTPTGPPSRVLWQVASGATGRPPAGPESLSSRVVVDSGKRIVATAPGKVFANDMLGRSVWSKDVPSQGLRLWAWGDTILAGDMQRLWLLEADGGKIRAELDIAALEAPYAAQDNPDGLAAQLERIIVGPQRAMVSVGTALWALDRTGKIAWRVARPVDSRGRRHAAPLPLIVNETRVVTRESGTSSKVGLRQMSNGRLLWSATDTAPVQQNVPPGGGPGREESWQRAEGFFTDNALVLREGPRVQMRSLAGGALMWHRTSPMPLDAMRFFGGNVLTAGDRLVALRLSDGKELWSKAEVHGARLAVTPAGDALVAVADGSVSKLDTQGTVLWTEPFRAALGDSMPDEVSVDNQAIYVTLRPRDEGPPGPGGRPGGPKPTASPGGAPTVDVIAYRLT